MGVSSILNKTIEQKYHLVPLEVIVCNDFEEVFQPILKEIDLSLNRVLIQKLVSYLRKSLNYLIENILTFSRVRLFLTLIHISIYGRCRVGLLQSIIEKLEKITDVHHISTHYIYYLFLSVRELNKNIKNQIISNEFEPVLEIWKDFIIIFLKVFVFWIALAHFINQGLTYYINQDIFQNQFITIFILDTPRKLVLVVQFLICFLFHYSN